MDIRELRCNNAVNFKDRTDFYAEVASVNTLGGVELIRFFGDGDVDTQPENINDLTPIKISPEWLLKLGFQSAYGSNMNGDWKFNIKINNSGYIVRLMPHNNIGLFRSNDYIKFVKYVHELQNIIYDLEGFELFKN